jgi:hypothetical protein
MLFHDASFAVLVLAPSGRHWPKPIPHQERPLKFQAPIFHPGVGVNQRVNRFWPGLLTNRVHCSLLKN